MPDAHALRESLSRALAEQGDRLFALALRVTRNPDLAADAVQEGFASAIERADGFRGEAALGTWLHRIVYNKAVDLLRRRGREQPLPEDPDELGPNDERLARAGWARPPDELLQGEQAREALAEALSRLSPLQRAIFELREEEGKSSEEIGEILGVSATTARVHLHRARLKLRALLAEHLQGARR